MQIELPALVAQTSLTAATRRMVSFIRRAQILINSMPLFGFLCLLVHFEAEAKQKVLEEMNKSQRTRFIRPSSQQNNQDGRYQT